MPTLNTSVQYSNGCVIRKKREERGEKEHKSERERVKSSLFDANMILYIENPNNYTKNLLELIN